MLPLLVLCFATAADSFTADSLTGMKFSKLNRGPRWLAGASCVR